MCCDCTIVCGRCVPGPDRLWTNRSAAYYKLQQFERALVDAGMSRRINPAWTKAYLREGQALLALERFVGVRCCRRVRARVW